ncbi:hypothetical protein Tco_1181204 [Tanacetum coccineum]
MLPIHRPEDQVVIGETSLPFSLDVVHARVQRIRGDVASQRVSISDFMVPLIEPLSAENLVGKASTSGVPATVIATTALLTTFVQANFVPPVPASDYEVADIEPHAEASSSPKIIFEQETLETSPEHPATYCLLFSRYWDCKPLMAKVSAIFCVAGIIVPVHKVSWLEACVVDFGVVIFFIFALLLASRIAPCSLLSSKRSRLISKGSSFCTMFIYDVLKVGMPISAGITASIPYVSENGVSSLLDLIMVRCANVSVTRLHRKFYNPLSSVPNCCSVI